MDFGLVLGIVGLALGPAIYFVQKHQADRDQLELRRRLDTLSAINDGLRGELAELRRALIESTEIQKVLLRQLEGGAQDRERARQIEGVIHSLDEVAEASGAFGSGSAQPRHTLRQAFDGYVQALQSVNFGAIVKENFARFQRRSQQSEAKANLLALFTAAAASHAAEARVPATVGETGWRPEPGNRYAYFYAGDVVPATAPGSGDDFVERARKALDGLRVQPFVSGETFLAAAVADLGGDDLDVWTIDSKRNLTHVAGDPA